MDKYANLRTIPFPQLAGLLGIDLKRFKRRKDNWQGYCPIHQSQGNNCFSYHDDGRYNCFAQACKGRGSLDLVMAVKNIGFKAATELLGGLPKSDPPQQKEPRIEAPVNADEVLKPFDGGKYRKFAVPCPWLEARVPSADIRERYGVFAYNNPARKSAYSGRVMIPVKCPQGVLYGYLGRSTSSYVDGDAKGKTEPKYLFPPGFPKSKFLFGAYELHQHLAGLGTKSVFREVYLVESPLCCMKFASMGLPAVSPFGWNVSDEQVSILRQVTRACVYIPDSDKYEEAMHQCGRIAQSPLWIKMPKLPDGVTDPEQMTREMVLAL